jgi:hypothetical protein
MATRKIAETPMKAASSWRRTDEIKKRTAGPFEVGSARSSAGDRDA